MKAAQLGIDDPAHLTIHTVRVSKPERTHRARIVDDAGARAALDQALTNALERLGREQGEMVEVPAANMSGKALP